MLQPAGKKQKVGERRNFVCEKRDKGDQNQESAAFSMLG